MQREESFSFAPSLLNSSRTKISGTTKAAGYWPVKLKVPTACFPSTCGCKVTRSNSFAFFRCVQWIYKPQPSHPFAFCLEQLSKDTNLRQKYKQTYMHAFIPPLFKQCIMFEFVFYEWYLKSSFDVTSCVSSLTSCIWNICMQRCDVVVTEAVFHS